jgi:hypothetical protein
MRKTIKNLAFFTGILLVLGAFSNCTDEKQDPEIESIETPNICVEGKVWTLGSHPMTGFKELCTEYFSGDTIIGGKNYKKLYCHDIERDRVQYECAMREAGKKVFCVNNGQSHEEIIYDFGLSVGETLPFSDHKMVTVKAIMQLVDGRKLMELSVSQKDTPDDSLCSGLWIEGVGTGTLGSLSNSHYFDASGGYHLYYCEENGVRIWSNLR